MYILPFIVYISFLLIPFVNCNVTRTVTAPIRRQQICGKRPHVVHYIYGGRHSTIEQWPWQVHLKITDPDAQDYVNSDYANCGASLLSDTWIITAAHCFSDRKNPKVFLLIGQNITRKINYKRIEYDKIILHPKYEEFMGTHEYSINDIALLKLNSRYRIRSRVVPLCLPKKDAVLPLNTICYITGFGATSKMDTEQVKRLREGRVTIKQDRVCVKTLSLDYFDGESMLCAGKSKHNRANSCQGDSGGPLVCAGNFDEENQTSWYLFGITSFGALDCAAYHNSVYTRVAKYVDWIENTMATE